MFTTFVSPIDIYLAIRCWWDIK